jgi:6-phosphogluconolactonase (cycloisomerase 2 family)
MKIAHLVLLAFLLLGCKSNTHNSALLESLSNTLTDKRVQLPNGWSLTVAGRSLPLGDLPLNIVVSAKGTYMAVTNNGQSDQSIMLIDPVNERVLSEIEIKKSWYGLVFSDDESKLYASGGNDNIVVEYAIQNNRLVKSDSILLGKPWPNEKISPTGLALDDEKNVLYIATKEDSSLYVADLVSRKSTRFFVGHEAYACQLSPNKKILYVSLWGGDKILLFDTEQRKIMNTISTGSNPTDVVLTKNGKFLYVATANDNAVSVIETTTSKVVQVLSAAMYPNSLAGSTTNALALSADEDRLYIANADNNCLAVFDVSNSREAKSLGFIPVGWYPTSLKVFNKKIFVTNGKGAQSFANPKGPNPYVKRNDSTQYIGGLFKGTLSILEEPTSKELEIYSSAVYKNSPYTKEIEKLASGEKGNPIPQDASTKSPIKYVFYIIKENRTYDQVLGDMPEGNGDSTLCLFPERVTPNHHALAKQFVLLDNFYVNAEVSADGHNWSMAAYANDYVEKTWPTNYGGRGGSYDYEGSRDIAWPKDGFIWDYCQRAGVSYRSYGEFIYYAKPILKSLKGHSDSDFPKNFDPDFPEYDLKVPDVNRFEKWKHDFDSLLSINSVPQLSIIRLPNDHTAGARIGMPTPRAMVAENDLAFGKLVEHISKSKIWSESAIFVLEDDAQNGPDHVDAHRSIAFVISPYVKRGAVVSQQYSTASMLRTIELILGLPPMSQYDAAAIPMWECFTPSATLSPYKNLPATYNINELNVVKSPISKLSDEFNLEKMDAVPDLLFSEVIWKAVKGLNSTMPPPVRTAFVKPNDEGEDTDK